MIVQQQGNIIGLRPEHCEIIGDIRTERYYMSLLMLCIEVRYFYFDRRWIAFEINVVR